jgi:ribonuclease HI
MKQMSKQQVNSNLDISILLNKSMFYLLQFDGASKSNPGLAGAGAVIYANNNEIWSQSIFVGIKETNNYAEYKGLLLGLNKACELGIKDLHVQGDSQLIIKQMKGEYKVNSENLLPLFNAAKELEKNFDSIHYEHIYRNKNKRADYLSNEAIIDFIRFDRNI